MTTENLFVSRFKGYKYSRAQVVASNMKNCAAYNKNFNWCCAVNAEFVPVHFGSGSVSLIVDSKANEYVNERIREMWYTDKDRFPGSLAVSIMLDDLPALEQEQYDILPKTNGTRYMLICFVDADGDNVAVMIDRSGRFHVIRIVLHTDIFAGSIFEGELVHLKTANVWSFQLFDCVLYCGKQMFNNPYSERLAKCNSLVSTMWQACSTDCFQICCKKLVSPEEMLIMLTKLKTNENTGEVPVDGCILVPEFRGYVPGKDTHLFKVKTYHTVDLKAITDSVSTKLYTINPTKKSLVWIQDIVVNREMLERLGQKSISGMIVECGWNEVKSMWEVIVARTDKQVPNNEATVKRTIQNIKENIPHEKIYDLMCNNLLNLRGVRPPAPSKHTNK